MAYLVSIATYLPSVMGKQTSCLGVRMPEDPASGRTISEHYGALSFFCVLFFNLVPYSEGREVIYHQAQWNIADNCDGLSPYHKYGE